MVSNVNIEPKGEICDSNRPTLQYSAISHSSIEFQMNNPNVMNEDDDQPPQQHTTTMDTAALSKKMLKLELKQKGGSIDLDDDTDAKLPNIMSPKSPISNSSKTHIPSPCSCVCV